MQAAGERQQFSRREAEQQRELQWPDSAALLLCVSPAVPPQRE
jgi:hypothetical protein